MGIIYSESRNAKQIQCALQLNVNLVRTCTTSRWWRLVCITIYKTQTIAFHLHPSFYSHGYYYILCILFGSGERRKIRIKEVVRKFAFYPERASARRDLHHVRRKNIAVRKTTKPTEQKKKYSQIGSIPCTICCRSHTIETRNIISLLEKLLPHQWWNEESYTLSYHYHFLCVSLVG